MPLVVLYKAHGALGGHRLWEYVVGWRSRVGSRGSWLDLVAYLVRDITREEYLMVLIH